MSLNLSGDYRSVSDDTHFPYRDRITQFILVTDDGIEVGKNLDGKRRLINSAYANKDHVLLAVWTGNWTSDIFLLDYKKAFDAIYT